MDGTNGNRANGPEQIAAAGRVPPLPPMPEFQAHVQKFQRMPDGETIRIVQFGALETKNPTTIYVSIGTLMQLVATRMLEVAAPMQEGWASRWNSYKLASERTQVDLSAGVIKFEGKDNLNNPGFRPGERP